MKTFYKYLFQPIDGEVLESLKYYSCDAAFKKANDFKVISARKLEETAVVMPESFGDRDVLLDYEVNSWLSTGLEKHTILEKPIQEKVENVGVEKDKTEKIKVEKENPKKVKGKVEKVKKEKPKKRRAESVVRPKGRTFSYRTRTV